MASIKTRVLTRGADYFTYFGEMVGIVKGGGGDKIGLGVMYNVEEVISIVAF